jgi:hypothetical protein
VQRLSEFESITINLPVAGSAFRVRDFDCMVVAVAGTTAALEPIGLLAELLPERIDGVLLSFVHQGRLIGLKGALTRERGSLRFRVGDGVHVSGRRSTRVDAAAAVALRHVGSGEAGDGTTINIATEGVLLRSGLAVATGDELDLEIALPTPLVTRGRVVRHAEDLLAVEFRREAHAAVAEFVIGRQEEKLRAQSV